VEVVRTALAEVFPEELTGRLSAGPTSGRRDCQVGAHSWMLYGRYHKRNADRPQKHAAFKIIFGVFSGLQAKNLPSDVAELTEDSSEPSRFRVSERF
jgi:hypothetical protein